MRLTGIVVNVLALWPRVPGSHPGHAAILLSSNLWQIVYSHCSVVRTVSRNGVFFTRMLSPIGRNAQACCDFYGIPFGNIGIVSKRLAWTVFHRNSSQSDADKIRTIKELLSVKAGLVALSSFDASQVDFMIQTLCTQ